MKEWLLSKTNGNELVTVTEPQSEFETKIKLSAAALAPSDIYKYEKSAGNFPFCKRAIGHVSVGGKNSDFKIGERVVVNPFLVDNKKSYGNVSIMGVNSPGLMGDFIYVPTENVYRLPIGIPDSEAVYAETIATALAILHKMNVKKGDYVMIMGCNISDLYLAKLCIYYQYVPIVVDKDKKRLKVASNCGVYYIIDKTHVDLSDEIQNITGGRMADFLVFDTNDPEAGNYTRYVHDGGTLCMRDEIGIGESLTLNVEDICHKELHVTGVYSGAAFFPSAINLLAMRVVELIGPDTVSEPFENAPTLIENCLERKDDPIKAILTF